MIEIRTGDFEIEVKVNDSLVAAFSSMNGIEGSIGETDIPLRRMSSNALLELAKFFIDAAVDRAGEEIDYARNGL